MAESNQRRSYIDPEWKVIECSKAESPAIADLFARFGLAFAALPMKTIFIDQDETSKLTHDHVLAIEAHEIAHSKLNHSNRIDLSHEMQEREADWLAVKILLEMNLVTSGEILRKRYIDHYCEELHLLDDYMEETLKSIEG